MRVVLSAVAYLISTAILAPVLFFVVIALAGPHSSLLPPVMQSAAAVLASLTLIVVPILIARAVWRRTEVRQGT